MARLRKAEGERRINIGTSLSNEQDQLLSRFKQAYCWREEHEPSDAEIREKSIELWKSAIRAYIEAAETDKQVKMM